jgi:hypothetical protein
MAALISSDERRHAAFFRQFIQPTAYRRGRGFMRAPWMSSRPVERDTTPLAQLPLAEHG